MADRLRLHVGHVIEPLLVLVLTVWINTGTSTLVSPPRLEPDASSMNTKPGSLLEVKCIGDYHLSWNTTDGPGIYNRKSVSFHYDDERKEHTATLTVENLQYTDTGYFYCFFTGTTSELALGNITSVYVFVNDPKNLFVQTDFEYVTLGSEATNIIPCRPTDPNVKVTLKKGAKEMVVDESEIIYDDRVGFKILYPTVFYSAMFTCVAQLGKTEQEVSHYVTFQSTTGNYLPKPIIDYGDGANHVVLDESFSLTCSVYSGTNVHTNLLLSWSFPNKGDGRISEGEPFRIERISNSGSKFYETVKHLGVNDVKKSDQGTYECKVNDGTGKSKLAQVFITVHTKEPHLNLSADWASIGKVMEVKRATPVRFVVLISAYPEPSEVSWLKNGNKIRTTTDKYVIETERLRTTLTIKNVDVNDTANYTLFAKSAELMKDITVTLWVIVPPEIRFLTKTKHHVYRKHTSMSCQIDALPPPTVVSWSWRPCNDARCTKATYEPLSETVKPNNETLHQNVLGPYRVFSNMTLTATESGYYRCEAKNKLGNDSKEILFVVSDVNDTTGFTISTIGSLEPPETTQLKLNCHASKFNFSTNMFWKWRAPHALRNEVELQNGTGITITRNETKFSYNLQLLVYPIRLNQSGTYSCEVQDRYTQIQSRFRKVTVKEISAPVVVYTNLNGGVYSIEREKKIQFNCSVRGVPVPSITWFRGNETLDGSIDTQFNFLEKNTVLEIPRVSSDDEGIYYCQAENLAGRLRLNATLQVHAEGHNAGLSSGATGGIIAGCVAILIIVVGLSACLGRKIYLDKKERREIYKLEKLLFEKGAMERYNPDMPWEEQIELLPYDTQWEFPKENLKLGKNIGQGAFGRVVKAEALGIVEGEAATTVAVKMLKEHANVEQRKALLQELKIMIAIGRHVNILNLLGACIQNVRRGELLVIIEYCRFGNIRNHLLRNRRTFVNQVNPETGEIDVTSDRVLYKVPQTSMRISGDSNDSTTDGYLVPLSPGPSQYSGASSYLPHEMAQSSAANSASEDSTGFGRMSVVYRSDNTTKPLTTCDLVCYSFQIAKGMDYLASRKLVHRDLAARNILLADDNVIKICDFGLAKDCYKKAYYRKKGDGPLPVKWMAIESIRDRVFSIESDIWSFGVVMWEVFSMGSNPYPGLEVDENFFKKLLTGYRMDKPDYATDDLYKIMNDCWESELSKRPKFSSLVDQLGNHLQADTRRHYMELNDNYLRLHKLTTANPDYMTMNEADKLAGGGDYIDVPSANGETSPHYMNCDISSDADNRPNYLDMRGSGSGQCFNPRQSDTTTADEVEMKPMLSGNDSDDVAFRPKKTQPPNSHSKEKDKNYVVMGGKNPQKTTSTPSSSALIVPPSYSTVMADQVET